MRRYLFFIVMVIAMMVTILLMVVRNKPLSPYEIRYKSIINQYDAIYQDRLNKIETQDILRVYQLEDYKKGYMVASQGYENTIFMYVVLDEHEVRQVTILHHDETQGYGSYVEEQWFLERLLVPIPKMLQVVKIKKEQPIEIVAITGATTTSEAVVSGINKCIERNGGLE